jgi:hypothetical protein
MPNKTIYLTKWEKKIITNIIKAHLENVKTNPYYKFFESEMKRITDKLNYN